MREMRGERERIERGRREGERDVREREEGREEVWEAAAAGIFPRARAAC
jgi:hypothetical protein